MSTALPAYRNLLRAARVVFRGDEGTITAAFSKIREGFRANAALEPTDPKIPSLVKHAEDVATILRQNVVQGKLEGDVYKLRIHEETERGDNDSVKSPGGTLGASGGKCCSS
ncbi:putative mitochondrial zinc maintenance protein [Rosellinia necatrix]|uniref:Mitochondrial zinc maintenance protein 1, mitochondrial n=1 Tax=Rosellinia necatrix TaxID=77044 RepID=A0A1W2TF32_ROSNE|nr:putative mitochondrial zinc maintenance protein [Rosellinia necatrix]